MAEASTTIIRLAADEQVVSSTSVGRTFQSDPGILTPRSHDSTQERRSHHYRPSDKHGGCARLQAFNGVATAE
jgi:hypothetical protein